MLFFNIKRFKLINFFEQYLFFISSVSNKFCACLCCVKRGEVCKILQRSFLFFISYLLFFIVTIRFTQVLFYFLETSATAHLFPGSISLSGKKELQLRILNNSQYSK